MMLITSLPTVLWHSMNLPAMQAGPLSSSNGMQVLFHLYLNSEEVCQGQKVTLLADLNSLSLVLCLLQIAETPSRTAL